MSISSKPMGCSFRLLWRSMTSFVPTWISVMLTAKPKLLSALCKQPRNEPVLFHSRNSRGLCPVKVHPSHVQALLRKIEPIEHGWNSMLLFSENNALLCRIFLNSLHTKALVWLWCLKPNNIYVLRITIYKVYEELQIKEPKTTDHLF